MTQRQPPNDIAIRTQPEALDAIMRAWPPFVDECRAVWASELHYQALLYHCLRTYGGVPPAQLGMNVKIWITDVVSDLFRKLDVRKAQSFRGGFEPIPDVVVFSPGIDGDFRRRNHDNTLRHMLLAVEYFVAMFPLRVIPRLFTFRDWAELPPEARAQRVLSAKRVPEITRYILEHEDDWVFSSLTAAFSADADFEASELDPSIGILRVPLDADFLINDGQHRKAAIEEALNVNRQLGDQTISVVLFPEEEIERSQQMFSDLNRTVQKSSRSLDILYDHRDPMNRITQHAANSVAVFKGKVEKERVSLSARSPRFITLSALYDANEQLLGKMREGEVDQEGEEVAEDLAVDFWNAVTENIPEWTMVRDGNLKAPEARAEFVHCHAVGFWALAAAGHDLIEEYPDEVNWKARLAHLADIDWRKDNPDWQGICMLGTDIITRRQTREATANYIRWKLGLVSEKPGAVLETT